MGEPAIIVVIRSLMDKRLWVNLGADKVFFLVSPKVSSISDGCSSCDQCRLSSAVSSCWTCGSKKRSVSRLSVHGERSVDPPVMWRAMKGNGGRAFKKVRFLVFMDAKQEKREEEQEHSREGIQAELKGQAEDVVDEGSCAREGERGERRKNGNWRGEEERSGGLE
jgi:hypothetical protein